MQKPSANAGMGSALGGGAAEQAFGGNAANVLTKTTVFAIIGFFVLSFALYLANLAIVDDGSKHAASNGQLGSLVSNMEDDAVETAPAATTETSATQMTVPDEAAVAVEAQAASLDDVLKEETTAPVPTNPTE